MTEKQKVSASLAIAAFIVFTIGILVQNAESFPSQSNFYGNASRGTPEAYIAVAGSSGSPVVVSISGGAPVPTSTAAYIAFSVAQTPVAIYTPLATRFQTDIYYSTVSAAPTAILNFGPAANPTAQNGIAGPQHVVEDQTRASQALSLVSGSLTPVVGVVAVWAQ